jgi:AcrR family transcriptional regulator
MPFAKKWTVVRFSDGETVAHKTDRGPVILCGVFAPLPQIDVEAPERADAARNRERVLSAAARLFAERGPECVTMEAVAAEAGVGKGTVFRRFGDRAGLARAVISEHESLLQEHMIRGPAPLGPGAPAKERLLAFGRAYLEFLDDHVALMLAAEGPTGTWLASGVYALYRTHAALLLEQAGCGERSAYLADVLMAPLAAPTFAYQRRVRGLSLEEQIEAYTDLVNRLTSR